MIVLSITPPLNDSPAGRSKPAGAGTELSNLLSKIGFRETSQCKCKSRARFMDRMGNEWCQQNIPTIIGWMREEAKTRHLPFSVIGASTLVRLAIWKAKRQHKTTDKNETSHP